MKKSLLVLSFIFVIGMIPTAHAACVADATGGTCHDGTTLCTCPTTTTPPTGFVPLTNIPGLTTGAGDVASKGGLANFLNNLYKYLIGLAAILAVIEIIWGGLEISTESVTKKTEGKERIQQALLGLVLVLSPALVFGIINPSIINLSVNLPPISQQPGTGSAGSGGPTVDPTTNCSVTGTAGLLQLASCPSSAAANTWGNGCDISKNSLTNLGSVTVVSPTDGVRTTTYKVMCARTLKFTFIDTYLGTDSTDTRDSVVRLRPLAVAPAGGTPPNTTPADPNNGSSAIQFASICNGIGYKTCISDLPLVTSDTPCGLTGASAATTWKCYRETLSCDNLSYSWSPTGLATDLVIAYHCRDNPGWTTYP